MNKLNKTNKVMELIKKMTVEELIEFSKEFDSYRNEIVETLQVSKNAIKEENKTTTKEEKSAKKAKSHKENLVIDKEKAFAEGIKAGEEIITDDKILTCATTKCDTVVGGQCVINNVVCNYSFYVQYGRAIVYSNDITKEQLDSISEEVYNHIPKGVRVFDAMPSQHPDSPTHESRWYYDELEEGSFIFSNPDGSFFGYTNNHAFIIRESGFMEVANINYVFGKTWRNPKDELKASILSLKDRAFGSDNNEPDDKSKLNKKDKESKNTKRNNNKNIKITKTSGAKKQSESKKLSEDKMNEAAKMQKIDLSALE